MAAIATFLFLALVFLPYQFSFSGDFSETTKNIKSSLSSLAMVRDFSSNNNAEATTQSFLGLNQNSFPESPDFIFVQKNSLMAITSPNTITPQVLGSLAGSLEEVATIRREVIEYTIQGGDTLGGVAVHFNISLETLLWANNLNQNSKVKPGQSLIILPVSGLIHHAKKGDTLSGIAKTYSAKVDEIIAFNDLSSEKDIFIGDILIVPEGKMPSAPVQRQPSASQTPSQQVYLGSSFIAPVASPYVITQGLHWYNAIDFSHRGGSCGRPVYAAAGGVVQRVVYGRTGYGYYVTILHPNGVVTLYGHLQSIMVSPGQQVSPGSVIGLIGHTGFTIPAGPAGCHLHFEVRGAANPFAR